MLGIVKNLSDKNTRRRSKSIARRNIQVLLQKYGLINNNNNNNFSSSYLLMDESCFEELLGYVEKRISAKDAHFKKTISAEKRLAATLRFLALGESFKELSAATLLPRTFLKVNIVEICEMIYQKLKQRFLKFPQTSKAWLSVVNEFQQRTQFPHCLGALGLKHIALATAKNEATLSYSNNMGLVLIALTDAIGKFIFIDIVKSEHLSVEALFKRSKVSKIFLHSEQFFPKDQHISNDVIAPYVVVADNSFPLMKNLITPHPSTLCDPSVINYNSRLSKAKQSVESAFSILTEKFQILQRTMKLDTLKSTKIILCCCVLHNFLIERSMWYKQSSIDDWEESMKTETEANNEVCQENSIEDTRNIFLEYFSKERYTV